MIDEVQVQGYVAKYIDANFTTLATPGTNLFSNDYIYVNVWFNTSSSYSNNYYDANLIDFVRLKEFNLKVDMVKIRSLSLFLRLESC